ncbi:MAG: hypothetical protein ACNS62_25260 [Candidatus Cyclobacteriaceae bacterium M3_2C_046]
MTRHEIRLRRQQFTSNRIQRHKDYDRLIQRHQKSSRFRNLIQTLIIIIILFVLVLASYLYMSKVSPEAYRYKPVEAPVISIYCNDSQAIIYKLGSENLRLKRG